MGNSPSKSPPGNSHAPLAGSHNVPGQERRVNRRTSINALSGTKASAADPSATRESATGQPASHGVAAGQQQRPQSRNVPPQTTQPIHEVPDRTGGRRFDGRHSAREAVEASSPVQVPAATNRPGRDEGYVPHESSANPANTYYSASHLQRGPPRLPLPIGDANATPGSPVIAPVDSQVDSVPFELENQIPQATISLDDPHVDEDEVEDEMQAYAMHGPGSKAVPTVIEWRGTGDRVFVTGTFVNWEKKFRLHKSDTEPNVKSTTLHLRPGTHHLKFIVDGDMRASDDLPTAVDFTNHLVNYIEVVADDIGGQRSRRESERAMKAMVPAGVHPPQVLPETVTAQQNQEALEKDEEPEEEPEEEIPMGNFRGTVPQFLIDIDREEEDAEYQRAANVIADAPTPPILPLFLGRSILNGTTPMKDDNSVLNYPNHTVLNHLATSSIKNGVLATSVTTRYKRKYVTTILYKPTGDVM
ncbi:Snf1 kinase complex beta-subunit Gal83, putative [Talaromyces stipitatus ATCC 10500]|uniref:Snf1 kinase complex beta-subunit Gal83, putative n=1 Tax=Talaromyces stipitatus (strain ATCC 10500 / CBS 375.48 / QM 6759 / NRRL 1006) TaxID=441959 RepID=B8MSN7_TALSN|nr:Snf1 kinase complex beta-subunit Gal83, putative [Talaromyces stipitatus ATCC 10500]EED12474.1 Snf1 kinase complex beta-subunit Gal83, putative [Talaromyces stipitatus ATCC 10500]